MAPPLLQVSDGIFNPSTLPLQPSVADDFLASLFHPNPAMLILLGIMILLGLIFNRRFIITANFLVMLFAFIIGSFIHTLNDFKQDTMTVLLCIFLFVTISFLSSTVGYRIDKIKQIQTRFYKAGLLGKIVVLFIAYFSFFPVVYVGTIGYFKLALIMLVVGILLTIGGLCLVYRKASLSLPQEDIRQKKTDYIFLLILVLIAIAVFIYSDSMTRHFIFYL